MRPGSACCRDVRWQGVVCPPLSNSRTGRSRCPGCGVVSSSSSTGDSLRAVICSKGSSLDDRRRALEQAATTHMWALQCANVFCWQGPNHDRPANALVQAQVICIIAARAAPVCGCPGPAPAAGRWHTSPQHPALDTPAYLRHYRSGVSSADCCGHACRRNIRQVSCCMQSVACASGWQSLTLTLTLIKPLGQKRVIQHNLAVRKCVQDLKGIADVHLPADLRWQGGRIKGQQERSALHALLWPQRTILDGHHPLPNLRTCWPSRQPNTRNCPPLLSTPFALLRVWWSLTLMSTNCSKHTCVTTRFLRPYTLSATMLRSSMIYHIRCNVVQSARLTANMLGCLRKFRTMLMHHSTGRHHLPDAA